MGANAFDAGTSVYDAGLYMEAGWSIFHSHYTLYGYIDVFFSRGIEYIVSPLTLLRNYDVLFVFQSLLIGISSLAIYWIGNRILKSKWISLGLVSSYLIYPPLVGTIWPDLHFQIWFIPLFLFAYYFYISGRYLISILLFFLASITHGQYSIILVIFALVELVVYILRVHLDKDRLIEKKSKLFHLLILLVFSALVFVSFFLINKSTGLGLHSVANSGFSSPFQNFDSKLQTLLLIFLPVLFLPILAKKWLFYMIPFFYLLFVSNVLLYQFPDLFMLQYSTMFVPFVYIGAIYGLSALIQETNEHDSSFEKSMKSKRISLRQIKKLKVQISVLIVITSIFLAMAYQPYGPLQKYTSEDLGFYNILNSNHSQYHELTQLSSLIPSNSPYVFFQNSMPELLPRPLDYQGTPLMQYTVSKNISHQLLNGTWVPVNVVYGIFNPYSPFFNIPGSPPYNMTSYWFLHHFLSTDQYGVLAENNGMVLIQKNFTGVGKLYMPYSTKITANKLYTQANRTNSTVYGNNLTGQALSYGPYMYLSPGKYAVTYKMKTSNLSSNNTYTLLVWAKAGKVIFVAHKIFGNSFSTPNLWTNLTFEFTLTNAWNSIEFFSGYGNWKGNLSIQSINVNQIGI